MELYRKVRLACSEGMSARAAAKQFGISRDSVKKMLSFSVPPGYSRTAVVKRPKLDGFTPIIDQWLIDLGHVMAGLERWRDCRTNEEVAA